MANKEKSNTEKMKEKFADKTMDVKQLENVAGGALVESQFDNAFLNCLLGDSGCKRIDPFRCRTSQEMDRKLEAMKASIIAGWAKVGVTCEPKIDFDFVSPYNVYKIDGKVVSRGDAMRHAQNVVGKHVTDSDWKDPGWA